MIGSAASLAFRVEWEDSGAVRAPELSSTWCRLELWVGDECVSLVEEPRTRSTRRSIFVSLYPLAEWIAYNWWRLQSDMRPTAVPLEWWTYSAVTHGRPDGSEWLRHHNLRAVGEGFPWPDLTLVPEGQYTRILWRGDRSERDGGLRYLSGGQVFAASDAVRAQLSDLVEVTLTRLDERGSKRTRLHEEWAAIKELDPEEEAFCRAAARLGLDPFDVDDATSAALLDVSAALAGDMLEDFLSAVEPQGLLHSLDWVRRASEEAGTLTSPKVTELTHLCNAVRRASGAQAAGLSWDIGYGQALAVRDALDLSPGDHMAVEDYVWRAVEPFARAEITGVGTSRGGVRLVTARKMTPPTGRFAAARALWHALTQAAPTGFLLTTSHTARQKAERAFAAELLAPAEGIAASLRGVDALSETEDAVLGLAARYGVSPLVIQHQIENHPEFGIMVV